MRTLIKKLSSAAAANGPNHDVVNRDHCHEIRRDTYRKNNFWEVLDVTGVP
jgi:hypothetical protein